jgi:hypothetical protein
MPDNGLAPPNMPWLWQPNSPVGQPNGLGPPMLNYAAPPSDTSQGAGVAAAVVRDEAGNSIAIADPSKIRSTFADFDPSKAKSRNISAGVAGLIAGGGAAAAATQQQQPSQ